MTTDTGTGLEAGTYEVLRDRLRAAAQDLAERATALNEQRVATFGGTAAQLVGTERIRTEHNCVPRDIVEAGGQLLFGYNVFLGLKSETEVGDVLSLVRPEPAETDEAESVRFTPGHLPGLLDDPEFVRDFAELYRYYKDSRLLQLRRLGPLLLAVFQTGAKPADIRVLRWRITPDGAVSYVDSRGERDHVFPAAHDFTWAVATREDHVPGRHPHVNIQDAVFVECVGGTLTVKVEDNTETGEGIYGEPVDEPLQSLADAEIEHARVGPLVLLRILPYGESVRRHLVFNTRSREVVRLDGIGQACRRLPDDQGIIFPGGYYLTDVPAGHAAKTFDTDTADLEYERAVRSPNGEDVLYVFHARADGRTLLLPYNVIRKEVATPWQTHGWSLFDDGTLIVFRAVGDEPTRVHPMQVWRTPFCSDAHAAARPAGTGPLARIGNADLVRGISDCLSVARTADEMAPSAAVFEAITAAAVRVADSYHWLDQELGAGAGALAEPLETVRSTAEQVIDEFERVEQLRRQADAALGEAAMRAATLVRRIRGEQPHTADGWVRQIAELRHAQGHLETLRDIRYIDAPRIDDLVAALDDDLAAAGRRAVAFLSAAHAFDASHETVAALADEAAALTTVAETAPLVARIAEQADALGVVTDVVGSLEPADATVRTSILASIGEVLGAVNRVRAILDARRRELLQSEGLAAFTAEFALLGQATTGALAAATTPQECDEQLGRLLLQVENLEARFGAYEDFAEQLATRREEIDEAFSARRQQQLDDRARHADRLAVSAERILGTVRRRTGTLTTVDDINTFFASDALVAKVRATAEELRTLDDAVRADELDGRLKAARHEAARALRDRTELYDTGGTLRLGRHRFTINTQPVELTLVPHGDTLSFAITATDYRTAIRDAGFADTRRFWDQPLVSESPQVYRAEYLAARMLATTGEDALTAAARQDGGLLALAREAAQQAYDEGYDRGVHDHDAAALLSALLRLRAQAGLLRFTPQVRSAAQLFWAHGTDEAQRTAWTTRAQSLARMRAVFGRSGALDELAEELALHAAAFASRIGLTTAGPAVGAYLVEELAAGRPRFVTSPGARALLAGFRDRLGGPAAVKEYTADLDTLGEDLAARHQLATAWLGAYTATTGQAQAAELPEAVAMELTADALPRRDVEGPVTTTVDGLLGAHPRLHAGRLPLRLDEFLARTAEFATVRVPAYRTYTARRTALITTERARLGLDTYRPQVMPAFVRNRLLDQVYLPLIGDNLAKQLGADGEARRTDSQGLLLLLSPPGYGKTTLMEYLAARLGLLFVKIDGPALGHRTTSLDPAAAPDATARREVEKINFALALGTNTLLHLDDIQHASPELLQKFIPLCDAQRRMEGVWDSEPRTFDLRGKRFAVSMAGNPFTESGARFRIPDMLANRADVWNLGDVLSGKEDLFALSHIENALTSNPVLAPLAARERDDIDLLARIAAGDATATTDRLAHPYTPAELEQILSVLRKLLQVRGTVLRVNAAYIASAAQSAESRTEPPFLLQGSYRNTNKLAERILPVMTDAEVEALIDDHYLGEAQTLTTGAEANLLKLAELRGRLTTTQAERWNAVKAAYAGARIWS
ncbi:DNA repair ATPase [Streptomyces sp. NPDC051940]|uniref:DNA repair ATPase n=1 Tax=Streptomyces sp. NPDC051940 TaxID=3155675 RepID=UPI003445085B